MKILVDNSPNVAVVGSADLEFTLPVPHMPAPGDSLFAKDVAMEPGGKAANVCSALAALGTRVYLFSSVGVDGYGARILNTLKQRRVNTDFVERGERATGLVHNIRDDAGNRIRIMTPGAAQDMTRDPLHKGQAMISSCQLMVVLADISEEAFLYAVQAAHHFRMPVMAVPSPAHRFKKEWLQLVDIVLAGPAEIRELTGVKAVSLETADSALNWFLKFGCGAAILYLGRHGAAASTAPRESFYCPSPRSAGAVIPEAEDVFIAATAFALCAEQGLREACSFGAAAAWRMNSGVDGGRLFPSMEEIRNALTV